MQMTVNRSSGAMEIIRPASQEIPMADDGSWTIFVYICGSNLESDGGAATLDINEMCSATASDKVRFVIETGGAEQWIIPSRSREHGTVLMRTVILDFMLMNDQRDRMS